MIGSALLQDKQGQRKELEQRGAPQTAVSGSVRSAGEIEPKIVGAPASVSSPHHGGKQMSDEERHMVAEKLESELRWTEAALQSRVQHLIDTKQVNLSPRR